MSTVWTRAVELVLKSPDPWYAAVIVCASTVKALVEKRFGSIPGAPPPLGDRAASCRFAPRCALVVDACRAALPTPQAVAAGHQARCIRLDVAAGLHAAAQAPEAR